MQHARVAKNLTPNPFPRGKGNRTRREEHRGDKIVPLFLQKPPERNGVLDISLSYHWVQGSPLPKEVWNPPWVPLSIK